MLVYETFAAHTAAITLNTEKMTIFHHVKRTTKKANLDHKMKICCKDMYFNSLQQFHHHF